MIATTIDFDDFINFSLESASRKYRGTEEHRLMKEKVDQMGEECKQRFGEEGYQIIETYFEVLLQSEGRETEFVYLQAYKDCVDLLKRIEVL